MDRIFNMDLEDFRIMRKHKMKDFDSNEPINNVPALEACVSGANELLKSKKGLLKSIYESTEVDVK